MASAIVKMKLKLFSTLAQQGDGSWQKVTVRGTGLAYDADGDLIGGTVTSIQLSSLAGGSQKALQTTASETRYGFPIGAGEIAKFVGDKGWNSPEIVAKLLLLDFDGMQIPALLSVQNEKTSTFTGSTLNDRITGGARNDRINGRDGDDVLQGRNGDDTVNGGDGNDRLLGGNGDDVLTDTAGRNNFSGGAGNDRMIGGSDFDAFSGGTGNDVIVTGGGMDQAAGGAGADTFVFSIDPKASSLSIRDYAAAEDHLVFADQVTAGAAFKEFTLHAKQVGSGVVYENGDDKIVLLDTNLAELTQSQFLGNAAFL